MKRKLWVILSVVIVLSLAINSGALAANPTTQYFSFQLHTVTMKAMFGSTNGATYSSYSNSETYTMTSWCTFKVYVNGIAFYPSASDGGLNEPFISLAAGIVPEQGDVISPVFTTNRTKISNAGVVFDHTIKAQ